MNIVKSVLPLLSIFSLDNGRETAVETRPALPDWLPAGSDLIPLPGQRVERIIQRVKQDRNVTIYEQEVIFIRDEQPAPDPEPAHGEPYGFVTIRQPHPPTPEQQAILNDWQSGRAVWLGGTRHPSDIIRNGSQVPGTGRIVNGRIVLSE